MKSGLTARAWNALIDRLINWRILGVTELWSGGFVHPWTVSPSWDDAKQRWTVQIEPGFIAGLPATVSIPYDESPLLTQIRLDSKALNHKDLVDAYLTERPSLPITDMRNIGSDATPLGEVGEDGQLRFSAEPVPAYFQALGVGTPPNFKEDPNGGIIQQQSGLVSDQSKVRLLRACDIVVFQNRAASETQWTTGSGVDGSFAQFNIITKQPAGSAAIPGGSTRGPYIRVFEKYTPPKGDDLLTKISGDWADQTNDAWRVATLYFVSPQGAKPQSNPDGTWTPYVAHSLFWNRNYALNRQDNNFAPLQLQFPTGLAAGAADLFIQSILAQVNDADNAVTQFFNNNLIQSTAWTV